MQEYELRIGKYFQQERCAERVLRVFSSSRTLAAAGGGCPSRSSSLPAKRFLSSAMISVVASLVSRLEETTPRPGRSAAMLSIS